jgi:hypothetical protein
VEHVQAFLSNVKLAGEKKAIRRREVIIPCCSDAAEKSWLRLAL